MTMIAIDALRGALGPDAPFDVRIEAECESTNSRLLAEAEAGAASGRVLIALAQSAGRGRRGRQWLSAAGDSLTFSVLWRFAPGTVPTGLSLAVGVAIARALEKLGAGGSGPSDRLGLKWPNDIMIGERKLAGVLVELVPGAAHSAVIGIGLNLRLPPDLPADVRAMAAALPQATEANVVCAALLRELAAVFARYAVGGFATLSGDWAARDAWRDRPAVLLSDFEPPRPGICRGVDAQGALRFECEGVVSSVISGEISLRDAAVS